MSQFSETMGSFTRNGNYPLEAYYIFESEQELKDFYNDELNNTLLHKGLLKIVSLKDKQILYWVIEEEGELVFRPLVASDSFDGLLQKIKDLETELRDTASDIYERIRRIIGTDNYSDFQDGLDNLLAISNMLIQIKALAEQNKRELQTIVGTEEPIIPALEKLPYHNFIEVVNVLKKFFGDEVLEDFNTLKKIQDIIYKMSTTCKNQYDTLQAELDETQLGVGLNSSGSFSPDIETNYLKTATSIMNALRILDSKIKEALNGITLNVDNRDVVPLTIRKDANGYTLGAQLQLSAVQGNDLVKNSDGLYFNLTSEYNNGVLILKINDRIIAQHNLGLSSIVENGYYDPTTETLVIIFKLISGEKQVVNIPVGNLIREWDVDNNGPTKVVELVKEEVINGPDRLSADVRLVVDKHNILEKRGNALIVEGTTDNITHNDQTLSGIINNLSSIEVYDTLDNFPTTGKSNILYLDKSTSRLYLWSETEYIVVSSILELGEIAGTAYPGNKGAELSANYNNLINSNILIAPTSDTIHTTNTSNGLQISFTAYPNKERAVLIPYANTELSGLITKEDKKLLESLPSTIITRIDSNHSENYTVSNTAYQLVDGKYVNMGTQDMTPDTATVSYNGWMSKEDKQLLESLPSTIMTDIKFRHGESHTASFIGYQLKDGKYVNIGEQNITPSVATADYNGWMSKEDKNKLDSIDPSIISSSTAKHIEATKSALEQIILPNDESWVDDPVGQCVTYSFNYKTIVNGEVGEDTLYIDAPYATTEHAGLITAADKAKLDNLSTGGADLSSYIPNSQKGVANGVATLDSHGVITDAQMPIHATKAVPSYAYAEQSYPKVEGSKTVSLQVHAIKGPSDARHTIYDVYENASDEIASVNLVNLAEEDVKGWVLNQNYLTKANASSTYLSQETYKNGFTEISNTVDSIRGQLANYKSIEGVSIVTHNIDTLGIKVNYSTSNSTTKSYGPIEIPEVTSTTNGLMPHETYVLLQDIPSTTLTNYEASIKDDNVHIKTTDSIYSALHKLETYIDSVNRESNKVGSVNGLKGEVVITGNNTKLTGYKPVPDGALILDPLELNANQTINQALSNIQYVIRKYPAGWVKVGDWSNEILTNTLIESGQDLTTVLRKLYSKIKKLEDKVATLQESLTNIQATSES